MAIDLPATEAREADAFGLHDPLTLDGLRRIEQALSDGSVDGAEAKRLRAIHDDALAPLRETFGKMSAALSERFTPVASQVGLRLSERIAPKLDFASLGPKLDFMPMINDDAVKRIGEIFSHRDRASLLPTLGFASVVDGISHRIAGLMPTLDVSALISSTLNSRWRASPDSPASGAHSKRGLRLRFQLSIRTCSSTITELGWRRWPQRS